MKWTYLLLSLVVKLHASCPKNDLVSVNCFKDVVLANVHYTNLPKDLDPQDEFAGFYLFSPFAGFPNTSHLLQPTLQLPDTLQYAIPYADHRWNKEAIVESDSDGTSSIRRNLTLQVVWPVSASGTSHVWNVESRCRFKNTRSLKTGHLTTANNNNPNQQFGFDFSSSEIPTVNETVSILLRLPKLHVPEECVVIPGVEDLQIHIDSGNVCSLLINRTVQKECSPGPGSVIQFDANILPSEDENGTSFRLTWRAFQISASPQMTVLCTLRVCDTADDERCTFPVGNNTEDILARQSKQPNGSSWSYSIRRQLTVHSATTSSYSSTSEQPVTTAPVEKQICLQPVELGSIMGVPFALILICLVLLLVLGNRLNAQQKSKMSETRARPSVLPEPQPIFLRRPQLNKRPVPPQQRTRDQY